MKATFINFIQDLRNFIICNTMPEERGTTLVIIDGQKDFHPGGSLAVTGADEDAKRIAALIRSSLKDDASLKIDRIVATLDSHHKLHIAHPSFWRAENGDVPTPFTVITSKEIEDGKWIPRNDLKMPVGKKLVYANIMNKNFEDNDGKFDLKAYCIEYCKRLEDGAKFNLQIWPEHCLIGSTGHALNDDIIEAIDEWILATGRSAEFPMKGQNLLTEMYSALKAEVEISPETSLNKELLESLKLSDRILICGQALSHCVNYTTRDLMDNMKESERYKVEVLKDCSSCVYQCEKDGEEFLEYVVMQGGTVHEDSTKLTE
mmetsp:Transcript_9285/g.14031  ORF Transcript_9285/g.14031 Transcript_9285/m.14031 type:complete len:318 (+) Transcript_9285:44-997(+)